MEAKKRVGRASKAIRTAYNEGYQAGIKNVVEWVSEYVTNQSINPTIFPRTAWQQKVKEWGIKPQ